jgi:hypothetical protein
MESLPNPTDTIPSDIEVRCRPGVPCDDYRDLMQASARLRARGDDDAALHLITTARFHRLLSLHPELDEVDQ